MHLWHSPLSSQSELKATCHGAQGLKAFVEPEFESILRKESVLLNGTQHLLIGNELVVVHPDFRLYILTQAGQSMVDDTKPVADALAIIVPCSCDLTGRTVLVGCCLCRNML